MDLKCHLYQIPGVPNMRDLGGYTAKGGAAVKMGRFIRSTALAAMDMEGLNALKALNIDCVIDLRSKMERKKAPDFVEKHGGIHFVHVPMLDHIQSNFMTGNFSCGFPASMSEMYIGLLENSGASFKAVFDIFADPLFSHYLFHCTAGKDRTGITAMLLLELAGVSHEIIAEDYSYTQSLLEPVQTGDLPFHIPAYLFESAPAEMMAAIRHMGEKYGGARQYLSHIGVGGENIRAIEDKLLKD